MAGLLEMTTHRKWNCGIYYVGPFFENFKSHRTISHNSIDIEGTATLILSCFKLKESSK